jgi:hypothetical protein
MRFNHFSGLVLSLVVLASGTAWAEDSGFLPSYEGLTFAADEFGGKTTPVPNLVKKMAMVNKVMVDQPEIFISADSDYKGMKPDDGIAISEALRTAVMSNIKAENLVEEVGPNVIYLRMEITDFHLKKKKRRLVSYTPVGLVANVAKNVVVSDMVKKVDLEEVTIEAQSINSATGENLGSLVIKLSLSADNDSDEATWDNLMEQFDAIGKQIACRIRNAKVAESEREDCKILKSFREG